MSRAKDLATMIFRCSAGYVRKAVARHLLRPKIPTIDGAWSRNLTGRVRRFRTFAFPAA
jgi:hypothetical protein